MFNLGNVLRLAIAPALAIAAIGVVSSTPAFAADHGDAPLAKANVPLDINDVYAFEGEGDNVVFVMTVNPLTMPGASPSFDSAGLYQFKIDNDGDAVADVAYNVTFSAAGGDGAQTATVKRAGGTDAGSLSDDGAEVLSGETTVGTGTPVVTDDGGRTLFAGLRDDPFFFDLNAFRAGLKFRDPGNDFFKGTNISAIVLEVPQDDFLDGSSTEAGVWGVTSKAGSVIDRMGRPAIATVFIPADQKDAFNNTRPDQDVERWKDTVVASLNSLNSDPALADALLPDILTFDTSMPMGFLNGRALADDVIDAELQLITGNDAATDNVDANDRPFGSAFPYLASPNTAMPPTPVPGAPTPGAGATMPSGAASPTRPTGVVAPDTGTGDGTDGGASATLWIVLAVAGVAVVLAGGATALRARR